MTNKEQLKSLKEFVETTREQTLVSHEMSLLVESESNTRTVLEEKFRDLSYKKWVLADKLANEFPQKTCFNPFKHDFHLLFQLLDSFEKNPDSDLVTEARKFVEF